MHKYFTQVLSTYFDILTDDGTYYIVLVHIIPKFILRVHAFRIGNRIGGKHRNLYLKFYLQSPVGNRFIKWGLVTHFLHKIGDWELLDSGISMTPVTRSWMSVIFVSDYHERIVVIWMRICNFSWLCFKNFQEPKAWLSSSQQDRWKAATIMRRQYRFSVRTSNMFFSRFSITEGRNVQVPNLEQTAV